MVSEVLSCPSDLVSNANTVTIASGGFVERHKSNSRGGCDLDSGTGYHSVVSGPAHIHVSRGCQRANGSWHAAQ